MLKNFQVSERVFICVFFMGMSLSKTLHALYFDSVGRLSYFSLSYAVMALSGALSFFYAPFFHRFSFKLRVNLSLGLYSLALLLRCFPHSLVAAILSALLGGIGAVMVLMSLHEIILSRKNQIEDGVAAKNFLASLAFAGGALLAGPLAEYVFSQRGVLFIAALFMLICVLVNSFFMEPIAETKKELQREKNSFFNVFKKNKKLLTALSCCAILCGFYTGLSTPYLALYLQEESFSLTQISVALFLASLFAGLLQPFYKFVFKFKKISSRFLFCELILALTTLFFVQVESRFFIVFYLVLRGLFLGASRLYQESINLSFVGENKALLLGLLTSSFLSGDILGAASVAFFRNHFSCAQIIGASSVLVLLNALVFYSFSNKYRGVNLQT